MVKQLFDMEPRFERVAGDKINTMTSEAFVPVHSAVPRQDEGGPASRGPSGFHIDAPVPDHERLGQTDAMFLPCPFQHAGFGFAAAAVSFVRRLAVLGMMRAVVDPVNVRAFVRKQCDKFAMNGGKVRFGEQSACDTRLVRNDKDLGSDFVRLSNCPGGIWDELKLFRTGEEIQLGVQSAITVEEKSNLINLHALIA